MEACILRAFNIDDLVIIPTLDHCRYLGVISHPHSIVILSQFSNILLCILILPQYDLYFSFSIYRLDRIDSGAVSFPVSTTDIDLGPDMIADSFLAYSTHAVPHLLGLYHHVLDTQGTNIHKTL
ncbi:hypothetical protein CK203_086206 [Vitis vinifera]|uniref:Uncharacterized protein n=1 Tax=Vitis vinifera TaxID=29760 RepID=A0A438DX82_VITVI|nr:hypothetical protein CK203_086206 [Vitis vinifera]